MEKSLSLFELNNAVRRGIESKFTSRYWVRGELAEGRVAGNGHFYGELVERSQDEGTIVARARINCWASTYQLVRQDFVQHTGKELEAGLKVMVQVSVNFHEQYGYSLIVHDIDPTYTIGDAAIRRQQILEQLKADGLLTANRELPMSRLTLRIAVVSSRTAAGYGDFIDQLHCNKQGYRFRTCLFPALMQGKGLEQSIINALERIGEEARQWDAVVIIRGGGSTTDLSDFDSYTLAACVAQLPIPVITGIGHDRDSTVLDYVAHTSMKTPTAVATFLISMADAQAERIADLQRRVALAAQRHLLAAHRYLTEVSQRLAISAQRKLNTQQRKLDDFIVRLPVACRTIGDRQRNTLSSMETRMTTALRFVVQRQTHKAELIATRLQALDPLLPLARGYSITLHDGKLVNSVEDLTPGARLTTIVHSGEINSITTSWKKN